MKNSHLIIVISLVLSGMLIFADNIKSAYAVNQTQYTNQGTTTQRHAMGIVRLNNILYVSGDSTGDRISTFTVNADGTLTAITQITCADCQELWIAGSGANARVYTRTNNPSPTIHEISPDGLFIARSLSTSCNQNTQQFSTTGDADIIVCPDGTNDQIDTVNRSVNPMTKTDGGSINSGAFACDQPASAILSSSDDVVFVGCIGVDDRIVVLDNTDLSVAQSPIEGIGITDLLPHEMSYGRLDSSNRNLLVCDASQNLFIVKWDGVDLLQQSNINSGECITSQNANTMWYNAVLKSFFVMTDSGTILNIDAYDGEIMDTITLHIGSSIGPSPGIFSFSSGQTWVTYGINTGTYQFAKFDWDGLHIGANGAGNGGVFQEGGGSTGGIDCADPNFSYRLICNLEGNGGLVGTSELLNQTGTNIGCMIGIIACTQDSNGNFTPNDPNIQTNGMGYLLWVIALGIMIGMFWVASRGQLTEIPTFLWFIGSIGITLVITVIGWIDPTALIISIVVVIALAVAKAKGILGGGGSLLNEQMQ